MTFGSSYECRADRERFEDDGVGVSVGVEQQSGSVESGPTVRTAPDHYVDGQPTTTDTRERAGPIHDSQYR